MSSNMKFEMLGVHWDQRAMWNRIIGEREILKLKLKRNNIDKWEGKNERSTFGKGKQKDSF